MGLINDTLMLSELEQISIDETIENVDIVKVTEYVLHLLEDNIVKRNLKVHVSGAAEMMANKNRIREPVSYTHLALPGYRMCGCGLQKK